MENHQSIRRRLLVALVILAIGPLVLLGAFLSIYDFREEIKQAKAFQREFTLRAFSAIAVHLHEQETLISGLISMNDLMSIDSERQRTVLSMYRNAMKSSHRRNLYEELALIDGAGRELVRVSRTQILTDDDLRDRSQSDEFVMPLSTGRMYFSPVYFDRELLEPLMTVGVPLMDRRTMEAEGVLVGKLKMKFMWDVIAELEMCESCVAYLMDGSGRIIAHPNPSVTLRGTRLSVPQAPDVTIAKGIQDRLAFITAEKLELGQQSFYVVTEAPVAVALRPPIYSLLALLVFILISLAGAIALGALILREFVSPMETLASTARAIAGGNLSIRADISTEDELGDLADAFNHMTSQLVQNIKSLQGEKEKLRAYLDTAAILVVILDVNGKVILINKKGCSLLGYEDGAVVGRKWFETFVPDGVREENLSVHQALLAGDGEGVACLESIVLARDGREVLMAWYDTALRDDDGKVYATLMSGVDITERKQLEEQLYQSQKMESVGRLAGGVAHDFNNLLSAIIGYGEIVLSEMPYDNPYRKNIEVMKDAGEKAAALTRQLLAFSRKQILEVKVTSLNAVVQNMMKILERVIGEDIVLETSLLSRQRIKADPLQMEQVLMNLIVNARDAMPGGGHIVIETSDVEIEEEYTHTHPEAKPGRYCLLALTDTGHGISREIQDKIFEPFFSTKGNFGTGLGLATVYGVIKQHRGHIFVYSEKGIGTTFKIYLPVTEEVDRGEAELPPSVEVLYGTETVLVVDDEPAIRGLTMDTLQPYGYQVLEVDNATEALKKCRNVEGAIDLLLLDVVMPDMNGGELEREVRKIYPAIKVLFMSGYTENVIARHGILKSKIDFLQKPLTPRRLLAKVRQVLDSDGAAD